MGIATRGRPEPAWQQETSLTLQVKPLQRETPRDIGQGPCLNTALKQLLCPIETVLVVLRCLVTWRSSLCVLVTALSSVTAPGTQNMQRKHLGLPNQLVCGTCSSR